MSTENKYPISKENKKARRAIRTLVQQSEWSGHVSAFPIKVEFKTKSYMDGNWGTTDLKGKGKNRYTNFFFFSAIALFSTVVRLCNYLVLWLY